MLTWPVTSIGWVTEVIQRAAASQQRINEFLAKTDYTVFFKTKNEITELTSIKNKIYLEEISYRYTDSDVLSLDSISLQIDANQLVGFVGDVGSGKSTIMKMLSGILTPSCGKLSFDRIPVDKLNWQSLRTFMSYVSQDVFLFSDSIRNNILFGNEGVSDRELSVICNNVCVLNEITSFRDGFDTLVGEGGITLSGGQKQRIALARALVKKPKFLLLDDALSNVDSSTEIKIMDYITNNLRDVTIIITSNRLSVLNHCKQIFVLKSGCLVESGTPKQLMTQKGECYKLFFNQLQN